MRLPSSYIRGLSPKISPSAASSIGGGATLLAEQPEPQTKTATALDRMETYFDRWDRNQNGQISWSEVRQNVASQEVKGEEAVALASLYTLAQYDVNYRGLERTPPVSYDRLFDMYHEYDTDEVNEFDEYKPLAEHYITKYQSKLQAAGESLLPSGIPVPEAANQGTAPSCGFLATTYSELEKNPGLVTQIVSEDDRGDFSVHFPGMTKSIDVTALTDTERALFSSAEENGNWITVLEKAWGSHLAGRNVLAAFEKDTDPAEAIEAWTGNEALTLELPKTAAALPSGAIPQYLNEAAQSLDADGIVVAWTKFKDIENDDFVAGHAYSLTGVDKESGQVSLRNPWGKMEPVGEDGKALDGNDDGIFQISFSKFQQNFQKLAREIV